MPPTCFLGDLNLRPHSDTNCRITGATTALKAIADSEGATFNLYRLAERSPTWAPPHGRGSYFACILMEENSRNAILVAREEDMQDGFPKCPYTFTSFLYLKGNKIDLEIRKPQNLDETGYSPFFVYGDSVVIEHRLDSPSELIKIARHLARTKIPDTHIIELPVRPSKPTSTAEQEKTYENNMLNLVLTLRNLIFSHFLKKQYDGVWINEVINCIKAISKALERRRSLFNIHCRYSVDEREVAFLASCIVMKKMGLPSLLGELANHNALLALVNIFMADHMTAPAVTPNLSRVLVGDRARQFIDYLRNKCKRIDPHLVYRCTFLQNNAFELPSEQRMVIKLFIRKQGCNYETLACFTERTYSNGYKNYGITTDILAHCTNEDLEFIAYSEHPGVSVKSKVKDGNLSCKEALKILIRVSYIIYVIHTSCQPHGTVYNDVKPENFLVNGDNVVICDLASISPHGNTSPTNTPTYVEDERADKGHKISTIEGDVFKIGKFIIELMTNIVIPSLKIRRLQ